MLCWVRASTPCRATLSHIVKQQDAASEQRAQIISSSKEVLHSELWVLHAAYPPLALSSVDIDRRIYQNVLLCCMRTHVTGKLTMP